MIRGMHGLLYSSDPEATRAFFRDQVRLPGTDVGEGWWIFDFPEGDLGVHPVEVGDEPGTHDVSFYCDEIERTVADLKARGVRFTGPVEDHGYGLVTYFEAPGGLRIQLYEPRYTKGPRRKEIAISFLRLAASGKAREAFLAHVGPGFRHHNPWFRGDAESLMVAMDENAAQNPEKKLEVLRAIEEGDLIAVHSRVRQRPVELGAVVVHIFRFEGNRITELWDLGQPIPESSPNENGMI